MNVQVGDFEWFQELGGRCLWKFEKQILAIVLFSAVITLLQRIHSLANLGSNEIISTNGKKRLPESLTGETLLALVQVVSEYNS
jgi:hypothetical protein